MTETVLILSISTPPLRSNDRTHWARRAPLVRAVRETAAWHAKAQKLRPQPQSDVTLIWHAPARSRSDVGALSPTLKAIIDGLVDAGIWPDDTPKWVRRETVGIERTDGKPYLELTITPISEGPEGQK